MSLLRYPRVPGHRAWERDTSVLLLKLSSKLPALEASENLSGQLSVS